jgi:SAM-dependent methyltransferase
MDGALTIFDPGGRLRCNVAIWEKPILRSLRRLNEQPLAAGTILDLGGGSGPLAHLIDRSRFNYIVVDQAVSPDLPEDQAIIVADVSAVPVEDESADMAICISAMQYFDQERFFAECLRVLRPGAILALHENGPFNPVILPVRLYRQIASLLSSEVRNYARSIRRYYRPGEIPEGFELLFQEADGIFSPLSFVLEYARIPFARALAGPLEAADRLLLSVIPAVRHLAFLNVVHLRKLPR